ncbi:unnamed protein product [Malus baccata var. baccata]|uniref:Uncharacterized protein n=1 Tax=Malus baccata TaxID=106549 RepID=A0A540MSQ3_MALBA|nr:hypothetical protein C1H46_012627 [Malus baccata]
MLPQVKIFIILLLLFNFSVSGRADSFKDELELTSSSGHEVVNQQMTKGGRKLLISLDAISDYKEPGPNKGHDPHN